MCRTLVGVDRHIVCTQLETGAADIFFQGQKILYVFPADSGRFGEEVRTGFQVDKSREFLEGKIPLGRVEDAEDNQFMLALGEVRKRAANLLRLVKQIGDEDDQASPFQAGRKVSQNPTQ